MSVVASSDPEALFHVAARELFQVPRGSGPLEPPAGPLLILRQGGLRDDLFELAYRAGVPGWFDPPVCVFHELAERLGGTARRPLGDFERAALLERILRDQGGTVFGGREGSFLPAVDRFVGELCAEDVSPSAFAVAVTRSGMAEPFQRTRDAALIRVYIAYREELDRSGLRDGRDTLVDVAHMIESAPGQLAERLAGRRELRIVGLSDIRGGWGRLLTTLRSSAAIDRITVYATSPPRLTEQTGPPPVIKSIPATASPPRRVETLAAFDEDHELEIVAARVRSLIEDGTRPHQIAVIARDARPYLDLALRALTRAGVPATARRRVSMLEIPVVRAVLALLDGAVHDWTRRHLVEIGSQPYFASDIDTRVVDFLGYRERITGLAGWRSALERLLTEARAAESSIADDERRPRTLPAAWVERARDRFETFAASAGIAGAPRPLDQWLLWLDDWLERDPWRIEERIGRIAGEQWDVLRLDLLGWRRLRDILAEWRAAVDRWPGDPTAIPPARFLDRLRTMLAADIALPTEVRRGVQVLEALAASHRSFDHVFLVGMNAGAFPRRPPSSLLHGEADREALRAAGLPLETTAEWDERERALFDTLVGSARESLTVSWVARDELGGATNPSSFVELLANASPLTAQLHQLPVCRSSELAAHAERTARIERDRATGRLSPWNGGIVSAELLDWLSKEFGPDRTWAPTQLEAYAKCPWSWLSDRVFRLRAHDDPDEDIDARVRGTVLHDALRRFYDQAGARAGGAVFLQSSDRDWAMPLLRDVLRQAIGAADGTLWLGHPALRDVKYAELSRLLERFLDFEIAENEKSLDGRTTAGRTVRTAVESHELTFDGIELTRKGQTIRYRGIVDRIEVGIDDRAPGNWVAAVDYKTSKWSAPGGGKREAWEDGVVLQVPLYAHALTRLRPGVSVSRVEYRAIKHAERAHLLSLVRVTKAGARADDATTAQMEAALDAAVDQVRRIRSGEFPARPAPSCHCPPFCHAWDICRVAGGPATGRDA